MNAKKSLNQIRSRRAHRTRARLKEAGIARVSVFRSNKGFSAQLINDAEGKTIAAVNSKELKGKKTKSEQAAMLGEMLAKKALAAGVTQAVFDRGRYAYHGRVAQFAEAARKGGLKI